MNAFPLIRAKGSNEHIMAALFLVLILYHIPRWMEQPVQIATFLLLSLVGFAIDAVASLLRHKRLWCCISAAITAGMISLLTPGVPLWGQILGVAAALLIGKQVFGGTGENMINPAMVGLLTILIFWNIPYPFFESSYLLIPAALFSLPFLMVRPFAGAGFILGMLAVLGISGDLSLLKVLSYGVLFWGCLVITDPVTVTKSPIIGAAMGFASGAGIMFLFPQPVTYVFAILVINLISSALKSNVIYDTRRLRAKLKLAKAVPNCDDRMIDLTDETEHKDQEVDITEVSKEDILNCIKEKELYGMGGAAFPTHRKLLSVIDAKEPKKYLLINGVECDPGLIHDHYLMRNHSKEISKGVELLRKCVDFESVTLAVKDISELDFPKEIKLYRVPDKYPIGAEKILIWETLNLHLGTGQIPANYGILVLNVQTVFSIYNAVLKASSSNTRYLTVINTKDNTARVVKARLGMKLKDIMEAAYPGELRMFTGGGMMQSYSADEEAILDRTINFLATGSMPRYKESPQCSGCGECSDKCPVGLPVKAITELVDQGKAKDAARYHAEDCILCGSCSYSCKAGRNLAARMKLAREALK